MHRMTFNGIIFSEYRATLYPCSTPLVSSNYLSTETDLSVMLNIFISQWRFSTNYITDSTLYDKITIDVN